MDDNERYGTGSGRDLAPLCVYLTGRQVATAPCTVPLRILLEPSTYILASRV